MSKIILRSIIQLLRKSSIGSLAIAVVVMLGFASHSAGKLHKSTSIINTAHADSPGGGGGGGGGGDGGGCNGCGGSSSGCASCGSGGTGGPCGTG